MAARTKKKIDYESVENLLINDKYKYPDITKNREVYKKFGFWLIVEDKEYKNRTLVKSYLIVPIDNNIRRFADLGWDDFNDISKSLAFISDHNPNIKKTVTFEDGGLITQKFHIRVIVKKYF